MKSPAFPEADPVALFLSSGASLFGGVLTWFFGIMLGTVLATGPGPWLGATFFALPVVGLGALGVSIAALWGLAVVPLQGALFIAVTFGESPRIPVCLGVTILQAATVYCLRHHPAGSWPVWCALVLVLGAAGLYGWRTANGRQRSTMCDTVSARSE